MAATVTTGANGGHWVMFQATTQQEIVDALGAHQLSGNKVLGLTTDDGTNFFVLACKRGN